MKNLKVLFHRGLRIKKKISISQGFLLYPRKKIDVLKGVCIESNDNIFVTSWLSKLYI
jgi:hypothetical protein